MAALSTTTSTLIAAQPEPERPETRVLPAPALLPGVALLPDPTEWLVDDATGVQYRRATAHERAAHSWEPGTYLVEAGALRDAVASGAAQASLAVPVADGRVLSLPLSLAGARTGPSFSAVRLDGGFTTGAPEVREYASSHLLLQGPRTAGAPVALLTAAERGFFARALVDGIEAQIVGPDASRSLDALPARAEAPVAADVAVVHITTVPQPRTDCGILQFICDALGFRRQCDDGVDNDGDRWVDWPDDPGCTSRSDDSETNGVTTQNLVLAGEIKWCTTTGQANWIATINTIGSDIMATYAGNGGTVAGVTHVHSTCIFAASQADATYCDTHTDCTVAGPSATVPYPYGNCNGNGPCYRDATWTDLSAFRTMGFSIPAAKDAQTIHQGTMSSNTLCGIASFPGNSGNYDAASSGPLPSGDSVSAGYPRPSNCVAFIPSHETGHTFDATHGNSVLTGGCWTVMGEGGATPTCRHNYFSDANRAAVNNCILALSAGCPRSGSG